MTDQLPSTADCAVDKRTDETRPDVAVCATCQMRIPGIADDASSSLVLTMASLRRRLAEQDTVIHRLQAEKDRQLRTITSNLLLLESQLRREKDRVGAQLDEKNRKIAEQDKCIRALLRLNRKLASRASRKWNPSRTSSMSSVSSSSSFTTEDIGVAGSKRPRKKHNGHGASRRRISWHSEVSIYGEDGRRWNASCRESNDDDDDGGGGTGDECNGIHELLDRFPNIREVSEEEDEDGYAEVARQVSRAAGSSTDTEEDADDKNDVKESDLLRAADEACDAFGQALDGYVSAEGPSEDGDTASSLTSRFQLSRLNMYRLDGGRGGVTCTTTIRTATATPNHAEPPPNQLGNVYNRVMSNHRSVIKPKDVKYKKISRVKSRSLEELRGRLKCYTRPVTIGHVTTPTPTTAATAAISAAATSPQQGYYEGRSACSSTPS